MRVRQHEGPHRIRGLPTNSENAGISELSDDQGSFYGLLEEGRNADHGVPCSRECWLILKPLREIDSQCQKRSWEGRDVSKRLQCISGTPTKQK